MNEMVERVARALAAKNELIWDRMDEDATTIEEGRPYWRGQARVAIAAMREPTAGMLEAVHTEARLIVGDLVSDAEFQFVDIAEVDRAVLRYHRAMIDAALEGVA